MTPKSWSLGAPARKRNALSGRSWSAIDFPDELTPMRGPAMVRQLSSPSKAQQVGSVQVAQPSAEQSWSRCGIGCAVGPWCECRDLVARNPERAEVRGCPGGEPGLQRAVRDERRRQASSALHQRAARGRGSRRENRRGDRGREDTGRARSATDGPHRVADSEWLVAGYCRGSGPGWRQRGLSRAHLVVVVAAGPQQERPSRVELAATLCQSQGADAVVVQAFRGAVTDAGARVLVLEGVELVADGAVGESDVFALDGHREAFHQLLLGACAEDVALDVAVAFGLQRLVDRATRSGGIHQRWRVLRQVLDSSERDRPVRRVARAERRQLLSSVRHAGLVPAFEATDVAVLAERNAHGPVVRSRQVPAPGARLAVGV